MDVYISTGAFKSRNIKEILEIAGRSGIRKIEISPGLEYCPDIKEILHFNKSEFDFLIHNYFPTQKEPFALNLSSEDPDIWEKSMKMCQDAITYVAGMGIPFYSVHCGYCFDTNGKALGDRSQVDLPRIPYQRARQSFVNNIRHLCDFAGQRGIKIAIENNVLSGFAHGDRELLLGVDTDDMLELLELIDRPNAGVLLDLAHAKVSASSLGFDLMDMVKRLGPYLLEVHVSDNDGLEDRNLPLDRESDLWPLLFELKNLPITLEIYDLEPETILEQQEIVSKMCGEMKDDAF